MLCRQTKLENRKRERRACNHVTQLNVCTHHKDIGAWMNDQRMKLFLSAAIPWPNHYNEYVSRCSNLSNNASDEVLDQDVCRCVCSDRLPESPSILNLYTLEELHPKQAILISQACKAWCVNASKTSSHLAMVTVITKSWSENITHQRRTSLPGTEPPFWLREACELPTCAFPTADMLHDPVSVPDPDILGFQNVVFLVNERAANLGWWFIHWCTEGAFLNAIVDRVEPRSRCFVRLFIFENDSHPVTESRNVENFGEGVHVWNEIQSCMIACVSRIGMSK